MAILSAACPMVWGCCACSCMQVLSLARSVLQRKMAVPDLLCGVMGVLRSLCCAQHALVVALVPGCAAVAWHDTRTRRLSESVSTWRWLCYVSWPAAAVILQYSWAAAQCQVWWDACLGLQLVLHGHSVRPGIVAG